MEVFPENKKNGQFPVHEEKDHHHHDVSSYDDDHGLYKYGHYDEVL